MPMNPDERLKFLLHSPGPGHAYLKNAIAHFARDIKAKAGSPIRAEHNGMIVETIFALSIRQPWSWLIVNGFKNIENRMWSTSFRGWFAIHAGKRVDRAGYEWIEREHPEIPLPKVSELETGGIVGYAELIGCKLGTGQGWSEVGLYGFILQGGHPCKFIPCRGKLGFFRTKQGDIR